MKTQQYIAIIKAVPSKLLLGGKREVVSSPFDFEQEAKDYLWAMVDQPNADKQASHVKPV